MELGLSLGESSRSFGGFSNKNKMLMMNHNNNNTNNTNNTNSKGLGFCMSLRLGANEEADQEDDDDDGHGDNNNNTGGKGGDGGIETRRGSLDLQQPHVQLDLLPVVARKNQQPPQLGLFPWSSENGNSDAGSSGQMGVSANRGFDVNLLPSTEEIDDGAAISSPNSTVSSFQIDFSVYRGGGGGGGSSGGNGSGGSKRDSETAGLNEIDTERTSSRASDDEDNGLARKKLRLSKEQSAFLEESFKEHNTLNPKQKLALAKQLNLRPRQVEVWFQNRRARTKLKQTEVDCEYLKRCCETLTEENRRLQKELQELRALKTSHPYYMQLPATTLTMCPSCERVATTTTNPSSATTTTTTTTDRNPNHTTNNTVTVATTTTTTKASPFALNKQRFYPFAHAHQSAA